MSPTDDVAEFVGQEHAAHGPGEETQGGGLSAPASPPGYLVIDTETSGMANFALPAEHPDQPHLAEIVMLVYDNDFIERERHAFLIKPDGWEMTEGATAVNGLTTEKLEREGVPVREVLVKYVELIDQGYIVVAHNSQFDTKIMRGELRRIGMDDRFFQTKTICTMRGMTDICKLVGRRGQFKWPTLEEAYIHISGARRVSLAHTATNDARDCATVAIWMRTHGVLPDPKVYTSKKRED